MTLHEEIAGMWAELAEALGVIAELRVENEALRRRIAELERTKTPPPSWVTPNRPKKADMTGPRRKRGRGA